MTKPTDPKTHTNPDDGGPSKEPSTYERIMVATREAKRLNEEIKNGNMPAVDKATTLAMKRVAADDVPYFYREEAPTKPVISAHEFEDSGDGGQ